MEFSSAREYVDRKGWNDPFSPDEKPAQARAPTTLLYTDLFNGRSPE